jgi:hypothetical protein
MKSLNSSPVPSNPGRRSKVRSLFTRQFYFETKDFSATRCTYTMLIAFQVPVLTDASYASANIGAVFSLLSRGADAASYFYQVFRRGAG